MNVYPRGHHRNKMQEEEEEEEEKQKEVAASKAKAPRHPQKENAIQKKLSHIGSSNVGSLRACMMMLHGMVLWHT